MVSMPIKRLQQWSVQHGVPLRGPATAVRWSATCCISGWGRANVARWRRTSRSSWSSWAA